MSIANKVLKRIRGKGKGWVFTPKDFLDIASRDAIDQTLSRLSKDDLIRRLSRGIYDYPKTHPKLGMLSPDPYMVAKAVSSNVQPHGAYAANLLGISNQIPARLIFLTTDKSKTINLGQQTIKLKHTKIPASNTPGNVSMVLQALSYLGKDNINSDVLSVCSSKLSDADKTKLKSRAKYVPSWMVSTIHQIANNTSTDH